MFAQNKLLSARVSAPVKAQPPRRALPLSRPGSFGPFQAVYSGYSTCGGPLRHIVRLA